MTTPPPSANTLDLRPLMFETFVCTLVNAVFARNGAAWLA
ncbi:hypothetical protein RBU07_31580, partial [Pseudomonas aeruginosa]|nr:hypothetical protein [Pseudomonas aeruginosa]